MGEAGKGTTPKTLRCPGESFEAGWYLVPPENRVKTRVSGVCIVSQEGSSAR